MLSETLPECNRFADLEEEKDLMEYSQNRLQNGSLQRGEVERVQRRRNADAFNVPAASSASQI
jgi:hypothetical protein